MKSNKLKPKSEHMLVDMRGQQDNMARFDMFIDDLIGAALDVNNAVNRVTQAGHLAFRTIVRGVDANKRIPRHWSLFLKKFAAKGSPNIFQIVLGWEHDTYHLIMRLSKDKHQQYWTSGISAQEQCWLHHKSLESLVDQLSHIANVDKLACHFLANCCYVLHKANDNSSFTKCWFTNSVICNLAT